MRTHELISDNFKRAKILVVEDNSDHWMLIRTAMEQRLPEVTPVWVSTPEEALSLLNDWSIQEWELPKLILQDLYMPERENGWWLLEQIKALPAPCSQIPVVVLSSSDVLDDVTNVYQRGGSSYIVKPRNFSEWLAYFTELRNYWWETVTLPPMHFSF